MRRRWRALQALHMSYTWEGVRHCMKRTYPPHRDLGGNGRPGWWNLIFHPELIEQQADSLNSGAFV